MADRREFLMLAFPYKAKKHNVNGWMASEKMDGIRGLWDGGISRGLYKSEVPWANNDKDERYVNRQVATGVWTRYGNILHLPDWFLDQLPNYPLDGEFFTDRKSWQQLSSIIKKIEPNDAAWSKVTYNVFEAPPYQVLFGTGLVNNPNYVKQFDITELMNWARPKIHLMPRFRDFFETTVFLQAQFGEGDFPNVKPVEQTLVESTAHLTDLFNQVLDLGGEGLILRNPKSYYETKRSHQQVKLKATEDAEGTVIGYIWGRETDKGSKLLGLMGALILDYDGKRLELSGFTDAERELRNSSYDSTLLEDEGYQRPGQEASPAWYSVHFPIGTRVTFKYRELSDDGIPKEARYFRKREGE